MLKGNNVSLRRNCREDESFLVDLLSEPSTGLDLQYGPAGRSAEELKRELAEEKSGELRFVILDREGTPTGLWAVSISFKDRRATLALRIFPEGRDMSLDRESLSVLLEFLFEELNMNRVMTLEAAGQKSALKPFLECGFQQEALLEDHYFEAGNFRDVAVLGLLREEYRERT